MLDIASCNSRFVRNTENRSNPKFKGVKVSYLLVYFVRGIALIILKQEQLNLRKGFVLYITYYKGNLFLFRYLLSLEYKEEVLRDKLVIKLLAFSAEDFGFVNNYRASSGSSSSGCSSSFF
jgi:hypothetical protein